MDDTGISILLANPPTREGHLVIREGRCEQSGGLWTTVWPPLSLATIAAFLEQAGHRVRIMDCPVERCRDPSFLEEVDRMRPQLVVLNVSTPTLEHDLSFPARIKTLVPECWTAAIGTHASSLPADVLTQCPDLDVSVIGEPEQTVVELAARKAYGQSRDGIPGTASRRNGDIEIHAPRPFMTDLDGLPVPAWHLVDLNLYRLPVYRRPFLMISSGRGCPFDCSFCTAQSYYGRKLRLRSPESVAAEMLQIQRRYQVCDFLFWTETFTVDPDQVRAFCRILIDVKAGFRWTCNSRVDAVDADLMNRMREAGCWMISFGIESASQAVLDRAGKKVRIEDIYRAVRLARSAGLQVTGHFILGLPGETPESLRDTSDLSIALDLDYAQFYCAAPFPGSRLYLESVEKGWIRNPEWHHFDQTVANLDLPGLPAETVMRERSRAIRKFYLRPAQIVRTLRRIRSFSELRSLAGAFAGFIRAIR